MAKELSTTIQIGGVLSPSLQNSINKAVKELESMSKETLAAANASTKLAAEMKKEESDLSKLKQEYASYVIEGREGSEEARNLATRIQKLSTEFSENRDKITAAYQAADRFDNSLEQVGESASQANEGFTVLKATLANLASQAISAAASAVKSFVSDVVTLGREFQATMSEVQAISGASAEELEILESTAREFGATTTFSAKESGDALKYMALAGWDVSQSTSALGGVLDLAAASGMELGMASDMVTDYLSAFSMKAEEAGYFADLLAKAQSSSNTSAMQLGEAYKNCAANFNAAGQDIETVTSILEGMANQGFKGSEAGTALAAVMRDITAAMKDGKIMIGDTSIEVMDAAGNYRDMTDVLAEVGKAVDGMGTAERAMAVSTTFTAKSTKGLNLILNEGMNKIAGYEEVLRMASVTTEGLDKSLKDGGSSLSEIKEAFRKAGINGESFDKILGSSQGSSKKFTEMLNEACKSGQTAEEVFSSLGLSQSDLAKAFENAEGSAEAMARVMNDNLAGDLKSLNSAFEELKLKVFDKLEPLLRKGVQFLTNSVIPAITNIKKYIPDITIALGSLSAVVAAFKWQSILGGISKVQGAIKGVSLALGAVSAPALVVIGVITAVAAAFRHLWNTNGNFKRVFINTWAKIKEDFKKFGDEITKRLNKLGFSFSDISDAIKSAWSGFCNFLAPVFKSAFKSIEILTKTTFDVILGVFDTFSAIFNGDWEGAWESIKEVFGNAWNGISEVFSLNIDGLESAADVFLGWFGTSWDKVWESVPEPVKTAISDASEWVSTKFGEAKEFVVNEAVPAIKEKWDEVAPKVQGAVTEAGRFVSEKFGEAKEFVVNEAVPAIKEKWDEVAPKVQIAVSEAGRFVSEKFGEAKEFVVTEAIPAIKNTWDEVSPKVESAISTASGYISTKFGEAKEFVVNEAVPAITKKWDEISGKVSEVIDFVSPYVTTAFEDIKTFITETVIPVLTDAFNNIKENIGPVIDFIKDEVIPEAKATIESIVGFFKSAWGLIQAVFEKIKPVIMVVLGTIVAAAVAAWEIIKAAFEPVVKIIGGAFKYAWEIIKAAWSNVTSFFRTIIDTISGIFSVVSSLLSGNFSEAWEAIKGIFSSWGEFFSGIWENVKALFSSGVEFIGTVLSGAWEFICNLFSPAVEWFRENVLQPVKETFDAIKQKISDVLLAVHEFISRKFNEIKTVISTVINVVKTVLANVWDNISSKVMSVWNAIHDAVSEKINAIKSTVSDVIEKVKSIMSETWDNISGKVTEIWDNITGKISEKVTEAKNTVSGIFTEIKDTIKNRLEDAFSHVSRIFSDIFNKIDDKITSAKNKVHEMIDAILEKFKFNWELPKLKLPHFKIEGEFSLNPPSVPSFGIDWFANGGIMTKPTVFGANGNNLLAGGEAGPEAILPLNLLWEKLSGLFSYFMGNKETIKEIKIIQLDTKLLNSMSERIIENRAERIQENTLERQASKLISMNNFSLGEMASSGGTTIIYDFSNFTWSPNVEVDGKPDDDFMEQLRSHEYEFFDWLEEFVRLREASKYAR
ncbi:MAG: phage tail tape measure protein [Oscillospiraceae bacterium]|nr:phage tail tape measure protein [Oscillospiraceae bacterium]